RPPPPSGGAAPPSSARQRAPAAERLRKEARGRARAHWRHAGRPRRGPRGREEQPRAAAPNRGRREGRGGRRVHRRGVGDPAAGAPPAASAAAWARAARRGCPGRPEQPAPWAARRPAHGGGDHGAGWRSAHLGRLRLAGTLGAAASSRPAGRG
ncbi:unnamed protein product, partial [Prorocentrum cordatum]